MVKFYSQQILLKIIWLETKHNAVFDFGFKEALRDALWKEWLSQDTYFECKDEYLEKIHNWLHNTKLNTLTGLDNFKTHDLIHGTTQAFDEAYYRHANRRLIYLEVNMRT